MLPDTVTSTISSVRKDVGSGLEKAAWDVEEWTPKPIADATKAVRALLKTRR